MNNKLIRLRIDILLTGAIVFCMSFVTEIDAVRNILDWYQPPNQEYCYGSHAGTHKNISAGHWHWGWRHWVFNATMMALLIIQIASITKTWDKK